VARDEKSGLIGIVGGTNWFNYGRWVPHIEAGAGVVATQAETNMWYAPNGIEDLKKGMMAQETIDDLLARDADKNGVFQLLIMDNNGDTACHTGDNCHFFAGSITEMNFGVAGNTLVSKETLEAVAKYFKNSTEEFGIKLIKSMQAGQKAGGDIRGMKSAAIKIAKGVSSGKYWNDIILDLRVDENSNPLAELKRLYYVTQAYKLIDKAESADNTKEALENYKKALEFDSDNSEIMFWMARCYEKMGDKAESERLREIIRKGNPNWDEYWKRLDEKK
jgi:uncharacterized Ntn-hydrolase superfamily protein